MKFRGYFSAGEVGKVESGVAKGDEVSQRMMESVHGGPLDPEKTRGAMNAAVEALRKQAEALREVEYGGGVECPGCGVMVRGAMSPKELAQTMAYTGKVLDEVYRLSEFAAGRVDSRVEVGGMADLLQYLSDEQVRELSVWVEAGKGRAVERKPRGEMLQ